MGLSRWLLIKVAGAFGLLPHQRVRRYKVTLFGENLGTFTLPIADHLENPQALVRPVITRPFKVEMLFGDPDHDMLYYWWVERYPEGNFKTVTWHPETPELRDEARRFFNDAHGLLPDGRLDVKAQKPLPTRTVEETRLIRAVLANRDDEQPYREYAAWLSAKGDSYGDYIRLTLDMEPLAEEDSHREKMEERRQKIVQRDGPKWVLPLADTGLYPGVHIGDIDGYWPDIWHGKKGVIEELDVGSDARVFPVNAARLFYGAPFLRKLSVNNLDITVADFAAIPQMAQIESLDLSIGRGNPDDYRQFAESPHLGGLRELKLSSYQFGPVAADHRSRAAWLAGVHTFDMQNNTIGDDGAEAFAESPHVAGLRNWALGSNDLTDRGLTALCRSPHLANLTTLHVSRSAFTPAGIAAVRAATFARSLKSIDLSSCAVGVAGAQALAAGEFPALTSLDLQGGEYPLGDGTYQSVPVLGDDALRPIIAAPWFRNLERFSATTCDASDTTADAIAAAGFLSLHELHLGYNRLTDAGVITLVRSKAASKLKKLDLGGNPFGVEGVKAIAETDMPALEELTLSGVACGPEGAKALAASPYLKKLRKLWMSEEHTGLRGREALIERFTDEVVSIY